MLLNHFQQRKIIVVALAISSSIVLVLYGTNIADSLRKLPLLPWHQLQLVTTLTFNLPIITTTLGLSFFLRQKNNPQSSNILLKMLLATLLFTHLATWWIARPGCISGCEGGAGGNDGYDMVGMINYLIIPTVMLVEMLAVLLAPNRILSLANKKKLWLWYQTYFISILVLYGVVVLQSWLSQM